MKNRRFILPVVAILLLNLFYRSVCAEDTYYTVTVSSGLHGTFEDGSTKKEVQIKAGDEWNPGNFVIAQDDVDDTYYFRGYHVSGIEGTLAGAQIINQDMVFVATYGIKNNLVEYYVNYVDEYGNTLLPRATYHGNVGDKPVIAYVYIPNYAPQTRNFTGTLSEDEVTEFTFVYRRVEAPEPIIEEIEGGGTTGGGTGGGGTGGGGGNGEVTPGGEVTPDIPVDIIDIDEPDTPAAQPDDTPENNGENDGGNGAVSPLTYLIPIAGGSLLLLLLLIFLLRRRKGNDKEA